MTSKSTPRRDGYYLANVMRRTNRSVPILMLTAKAGDDDRIRGLELGVDDYIAKPFNLRELLLKVARALDRNESRPIGQSGEVKSPIVVEQIEMADVTLDVGERRLKGPQGMQDLTEIERI